MSIEKQITNPYDELNLAVGPWAAERTVAYPGCVVGDVREGRWIVLSCLSYPPMDWLPFFFLLSAPTTKTTPTALRRKYHHSKKRQLAEPVAGSFTIGRYSFAPRFSRPLAVNVGSTWHALGPVKAGQVLIRSARLTNWKIITLAIVR